MLFKFLAASIAISAVAAVPVTGTKPNEDAHSLDARIDELKARIDELKDAHSLDARVDEVKAQSDGIPDHDVALAKVATRFAWAAYYPGNKGRFADVAVCYGKYEGKSNGADWPGMVTTSQVDREADCEDEVDGWEFQGKIEVQTGSKFKLLTGSAAADIYYKGSSCLIAIAGTDDPVDGTWSDTLGNINMSPRWIGSHKQFAVGKGNDDYYLTLQTGIQKACADKTIKIAPCHSLGAGAAEICVGHGDADRFFAFGPPKVWLAQNKNGKIQNNVQIRTKRITGGQATCTKDKDFLFPDSYSFYACDRTRTIPGLKAVKERGGCVGLYDVVPASGFGSGGGVHCAKTIQLYKDKNDKYGLELMRPDQPFSASGSNVGLIENVQVLQIHPEPTSYLPWTLALPSPSDSPSLAGTFYITGGHKNQYCCDEDGGVKCNRGGPGPWEKFNVEPLDDGKYAIKGGREGKYCCDDNHFVCNRGGPGPWEKFTFEDLGGGKYAIKGSREGKYCKDNGDGFMKCDADAIGASETFTLASA